MCKQSVHHVSTTKYLWSIVIIGRQRLVKSFFGTISVFGVSMDLVQNLQKNVHGPDPWQGAHGHGPWKWSMDPVQRGGPWTRGPCFVLTRQLLPSARCQRAKHLLKKPLNSFFLRPGSQILAYKTMWWVFVDLTLTWCSQVLEMWSIHTGE